MHEIIFYEDRSGRVPVLEYMQELSKSKSKDSRIKLSKIQDYVKVLSMERMPASPLSSIWTAKSGSYAPSGTGYFLPGWSAGGSSCCINF